MKIERSKEWWTKMIEREGDAPIGASVWFGVWCERDGEPGFWRNTSDGREPLQTTQTEAKRIAALLNEGAKERTDSIGWQYEARPMLSDRVR